MTRDDEMRVSAVIPAFNAERFLRRTLDSVIAQEFDDLEILVVDDGSSDRTRDVVASAGPRVKLVPGPARGVSAARNEGARVCRGRYIAFLDHDDLWEPEKIRKQVRLLDGDPSAALVFTQARVERHGQLTETFPIFSDAATVMANAYENLVHWNFIPMSAVMVRREALLPFDPRYQLAEDWDLWLRIASASGPGSLRFISEPLTRYRILGGRATERMADLRLEDIEIFERQIEANPWLERSDAGRCRATRHRLHEEAGYWLLQEGREPEARRALRRAWRLRPASLKPLGYLMASLLPRFSAQQERA